MGSREERIRLLEKWIDKHYPEIPESQKFNQWFLTLDTPRHIAHLALSLRDEHIDTQCGVLRIRGCGIGNDSTSYINFNKLTLHDV